jgi:hypothetical protein
VFNLKCHHVRGSFRLCVGAEEKVLGSIATGLLCDLPTVIFMNLLCKGGSVLVLRPSRRPPPGLCG